MKIIKGMTGKTHSEETKRKISESQKGKPRKHHTEETKKKLSIIRQGINNPFFGKHHSIETKDKWEKSRKGKIPWNKGLTKDSDDRMNKISSNVKKSCNKPEYKENVSKRMKEWQAFYMIKRIKNPSNEELKLRDIVFELFPNLAVHSYKLLNYCLDIAIPKYKIGIEYDGYYHFNTDYSLKYFEKRKQEIKEKGWILISYNMFYPFPNKAQVLQDIKISMESCNENII